MTQMRLARQRRTQERKKAEKQQDINKNRLYIENTNKIFKLKREITEMYNQLEMQYNEFELAQLENQLRDDKKLLQKAFDQTRLG